MSTVTIYHDCGETVVDNPEFVDCLLNVNEVAVDGDVYTGVTQVTHSE